VPVLAAPAVRGETAHPSSPAPDELIATLRDTFLSLRRRQLSFLRSRELSFTEWAALELCARGPARGLELADATGLSSAGVTDVLDRLEGRRLVRRSSDPDDRRAVRAQLTASGRRLYGETRQVLRQRARELAEQMTAEERRALSVGLAALGRAREALEPTG
jgi:DNA-binding MarR family transcriptional regulator